MRAVSTICATTCLCGTFSAGCREKWSYSMQRAEEKPSVENNTKKSLQATADCFSLFILDLLSLINQTCCSSFPTWSLCLANWYKSSCPSSGDKSHIQLTMHQHCIATSLFAVSQPSKYSCILLCWLFRSCIKHLLGSFPQHSSYTSPVIW